MRLVIAGVTVAFTAGAVPAPKSPDHDKAGCPAKVAEDENAALAAALMPHGGSVVAPPGLPRLRHGAQNTNSGRLAGVVAPKAGPGALSCRRTPMGEK